VLVVNYSFEVLGTPEPKGSTKAFVVRGRPVITSANPKAKGWAATISEVLQAWPHGLVEGEVYLVLTFTLSRPPSVSVKKRPSHTVKPDLDKLVRCAIDAMTGIVFRDDAQVTAIEAQKWYGDTPGLEGVITWKEAE
jgi:Holliday junction resolvase RusA-like endonuclease